MKRLYKLFALVLVLAALLVPLAGCQNSDADAQVVNILSVSYTHLLLSPALSLFSALFCRMFL